MNMINMKNKLKDGRTKKERIRNNKFRGKTKERQDMQNYRLRGYEVTRTGIGSDFEAKWINPFNIVNPFTGRKKQNKNLIVESKAGKSKLSKLQRKEAKKHPRRYKIERNPYW